MAELLVKLSDNTSSDQAKSIRGWKRGDVVIAMPNGWQWGAEEGPPKFCVVKMPAVSAAAVNAYLTPVTETVEVVTKLPFDVVSQVPALLARNDGVNTFITVTQMKSRRGSGVDLDTLMAAVKNSTIAGTTTTINGTEYLSGATLTLANLVAFRKARLS